jgi:Arc/MetJ-type ribon-helix-helix transcriptional regulator
VAVKYRAQILLEPEQQRSLAKIAEERGRSVSEVVRQAVQEFLDADSRGTHKRRQHEALLRMDALREELRTRHGTLSVDLLQEARDERDADMDRLWQDGR